MSKTEFDYLSESYDRILDESLAFVGVNGDYYSQYKVADLHSELNLCQVRQSGIRILNFGCGTGRSERFLADCFPEAEIYGVDISAACIETARKRKIPRVNFMAYDGGSLPFEDRFFHVVFVANVFHHIRPEAHAKNLRKIVRVLVPGGRLFVYEHNPLNLFTLLYVRDCPLDKNVQLLYPWYCKSLLIRTGFTEVTLRFKVFIPPRLSQLRWLDHHLGCLPLGAQYRCSGVRSI